MVRGLESDLASETTSNKEIESLNFGWWILGGVLVLGLVYYWNYENNRKENQNNF